MLSPRFCSRREPFSPSVRDSPSDCGKGSRPFPPARHSARLWLFSLLDFIARDKIEAIAQRNDKFREIDKAIGRQGPKLIFLLRLSPVIPFNLSNYFYGLTSVKFWPYVLASWIGMMPGTFLYVYIGTAAKAAVSAGAGGEAMKHGWQYWTFLSVGLVATITVTIWVTKIARDALRKTEISAPERAS